MISKTGYLKSALLLLSALSLNTWGQADLKHSIVKNVIVLIADGCGFNHLEATACYQNGNSGPLPFEHDFMKLAVSTYPAGGSYDPQAAWSDFNYVKQGPTDSAAAATAMATGVKTRNGTLGLDPAGNPLENVVAKAEKMGKATGVVTTVMFSHATPAAFVVHNYDRGKYDLIAQEMLLKSPLEVIMGTGHPWYDDNGVKKAGDDLSPPENVPEGDYRYVGGSDLWKQLSNGIVGGDCDGDAKPDPWTMIQSPGDFLKLTNGDTPKRVLGVA
ncbi:MAG: alkaline phosphatase, partial [Candidatus Hydrogenedentes bacterium]|nr:alkaline phosphatase [Candidatus Hydrogenedentota bacterium]